MNWEALALFAATFADEKPTNNKKRTIDLFGKDGRLVVDRAASGRATCHGCQKKIDMGQLRLAVVDIFPRWHHLDCESHYFSNVSPDNMKVPAVIGHEELGSDDLAELKSRLEGLRESLSESSEDDDDDEDEEVQPPAAAAAANTQQRTPQCGLSAQAASAASSLRGPQNPGKPPAAGAHKVLATKAARKSAPARQSGPQNPRKPPAAGARKVLATKAARKSAPARTPPHSNPSDDDEGDDDVDDAPRPVLRVAKSRPPPPPAASSSSAHRPVTGPPVSAEGAIRSAEQQLAAAETAFAKAVDEVKRTFQSVRRVLAAANTAARESRKRVADQDEGTNQPAKRAAAEVSSPSQNAETHLADASASSTDAGAAAAAKESSESSKEDNHDGFWGFADSPSVDLPASRMRFFKSLAAKLVSEKKVEDGIPTDVLMNMINGEVPEGEDLFTRAEFATALDEMESGNAVFTAGNEVFFVV